MIVTYEEIKSLFHVKDRRCIERGLHNKVTFINENTAHIKDRAFKEIVRKFREEGTLTTDEVCELYSVPEGTVINMANSKIIPSFQLVESKGSQKLFFKSEIEACGGELFLMYSKQTNTNFLHYLVRALSTELVDQGIMQEDERKVFNMVYTSGYSLDEVAVKMNLTYSRVQQITKKVNMRLMLAIREYLRMGATIKTLQKEKEVLLNKYTVLLGTVSEETRIKSETVAEKVLPVYQVLKERIKDSRLSVRAIRCLNSADIMTLGDLISWKQMDLFKLRNLGKKTYNEIIAYVGSTGFRFGTNIKQYGLLTTEEERKQETITNN